METVVVFGGTGLLGMAVVKKMIQTHNVIAPSRAEFNIEQNIDVYKIRNYLSAIRPKYVINCAGILVAEAQQDYERAVKVNSIFPMQLGVVCNELGIKMLHFSTNCVFEGTESTQPYHSWDTPNSDEPYGMSKADGESNLVYTTIRTTFIGYSRRPNDTGLFNWFLKSGDSIKGYDVLWNGVTTLDIADNLFFFLSLENGIYHFADSQNISKYDLLTICNNVFGSNKQIEYVHGGGKNKLLLPTWNISLPPWKMRIERLQGEIEREWMGEGVLY